MSSSGNRVSTLQIKGTGAAHTIGTAGCARRVEVRRIVSATEYVDYLWQEGDLDDSAIKHVQGAAYAAPSTITSNGITQNDQDIVLGTDISVSGQTLKIVIYQS